MNEQKAFIFDMDGVVIDSERTWKRYGEPFYIKLFGKDIRKKIGETRGITASVVYERAVRYGFSMKKEKFFELLDKKIAFVYSKSKITDGINILAGKLSKLGFKLALVSSSRQNWIDLILPRIKFSKKLAGIISINDTPILRSKPFPDAYIKAIKDLGATSKKSIILEDSNMGIKAAKASGAFVIGFRQLLVPDYKQIGADMYANTMYDVIKIIESLNPFF